MATTPDMMAAMEEMSETEGEDQTDTEGSETDDGNSYQGDDLTVPPHRYEKLEINGETYDLRDPEQALQAQQTTDAYRERVRSGEIFEYEGRSTEMWKGGRSRILYDELRADMAVDYHNGDYDVPWEQQHEEAQRIISIRAAQMKAQGV